MSARDVIDLVLRQAPRSEMSPEQHAAADAICRSLANQIRDALPKMPLPDRLALARALVPEYVVVPREPTQDMADRGGWRITSEVAWGVIRGEEHTTDVAAAAVYRAMIAATEAPDV